MEEVIVRVEKKHIVFQLRPPTAGLIARVKRIPGRMYQPSGKRWVAPASPTVAKSVVDTFAGIDLKTDSAFDTLLSKYGELLATQAAKTSDALEQPAQRKCDSWNHQLRGYHFAMNLPAAMLYMGMGSGKSKIAVDIVFNRGHKRVLICAPKTVIDGDTVIGSDGNVDTLAVWPREFYKWSPHDRWACWNDSRGTCEKRGKAMTDFLRLCELRGDVAIVLINYEAVWRPGIKEAVLLNKFDLVIADEAHKIKSPDGSASKFFAALGDVVPYRLGLTGTLMPHSPLDVYGQYRFLDKGIFGTSFSLFRARYAMLGGWEGKQVVGYQNEDELKYKVELLSYHVDSDVLDLPEELPPTYRLVMLSPEVRRIYNQMEGDFVADIKAGVVMASNSLARLLRLQQITSGYLPDPNSDGEQCEVFGREKRSALEDIFEEIESKEPVVVFARFRFDLDQIKAAAEASGRSYSELSGRGNDLKNWQAGGSNVIGVQIQAGGVGIDLTRACYCIYYSMGFSLGDYLQSLARTRRPGQKRPVHYIHIIADKTIDQKVYKALKDRQDVINSIFHSVKNGVDN